LSYSIEKLARRHDVDAFDCGSVPLNQFLSRYALLNQSANASQTWVAVDGGGRVVGFHSLVVGHIEHAQTDDRMRKGLARHPVPVMILARLAVRSDCQGIGLGSSLLQDASRRTLVVAEIAGIRALVIHAKDERARDYYLGLGFKASPTGRLHVYRLVSDLRRELAN
jgi:GNAT superfamily N-acetyltransferase